MAGDWTAVIPFVTAIALAMAMREIIPGLAAGLVIGAFLVEPAPLPGLDTAVSTVLTVLRDPTNLEIAGFLYLFGGLVGMMRIAGGIKGVAAFLEDRVGSLRGALATVWFTLPFTFVTPSFRLVTVGPLLHRIRERTGGSKHLFGYVLDVSTVPPIILLPVGTAFVGYMTSVISTSLNQSKIEADAYNLLLQSIPFNFFAWLAIAGGLLTVFRTHDHGDTANGDDDGRDDGEASDGAGDSSTADEAETRGSMSLDRYRESAEEAAQRVRDDLHDRGLEEELEQVEPRPWNLAAGLGLLLGSTGWFLYDDGRSRGGTDFVSALLAADVTRTLLISAFVTVLGAFVLYRLRGLPTEELTFHFFRGASRLTKVVVLLVLVWSLSELSRELGLNGFVVGLIGGVPAPLVPVTFFAAGALLAYFIASSWGTWGLLMPLGVSVAAATGAPLALTVGAVFASGTFGSFASPLGDTTLTTAALLDLKPIDHARHKLRPALVAAGLAAALYGAAGYWL